jgi:predicted NAD-dependent protein-ADP-ribosyltransferase YbiA (DUF1768 family)
MKTKIVAEQWFILHQETPGRAKRAGRQVTLRKDWDSRKLQVMLFLLYQKFSNPTLKAKLLAVDEPLIEDNKWHDNYWGHCVCTDCATKVSGNWLGRLLNEVKKYHERRK